MRGRHVRGLRWRRGAKPALRGHWLRRRARALILRASRRCGCICLRWGRASTLLCCCCTILPATGGPWRRGGAASGVAALPVQYADYTLWQHAVLGSEDDGESAIARQLSFWTSQLEGLPDQIDLPLDRARPAVSSYRGGSVGLRVY